MAYLKTLFNEEEINYAYLITDDDSGAVRDINWCLIMNKLWTFLIQEKYFDYQETSLLIETLRIQSVNYYIGRNIIPRELADETYDRAINLTSTLFLDPTTTNNPALESIHFLFSSQTECFAYLACNPEYPSNNGFTIQYNA